MASSLGPMPSVQQIVRSCLRILYKATAILLVIFALIFLLFWAFLSSGNRSIEDNTIGKVPITQLGEMQVGYQHDGDISYNYFVRIVGSTTAYSEWTYFGSDIEASGKCKSATSADGRFTCIYAQHDIRPRGQFLLETMPLMVIYDRNSGLIWPTEKSDQHFTGYWLEAWRTIRLSNPELPEAPE